jgi:hypothetical protein
MSPEAVTPNPNPNNTNMLSGAWEGIKGAPRWVYVAIIIGGIALYYSFSRFKPTGTSKEGKEGIEATDSNDVFSPISNREGEAIEELAYWYVEVAPAGWASTLNGIATQFYGNTNRVGEIQEANPNITQRPYDKLPTGLKVKVPR